MRKEATIAQYAWVLEVRPGYEEEYKRRHEEIWPEMVEALKEAGIRNYSIFRHGATLFAYFEYVGDDFSADMARMAADPVTQEWWSHTAPLQEPLPGRGPDQWWLTIPEVFHVD